MQARESSGGGLSHPDWSDPRLSAIADRGFLARLSPDLIEELTSSGRPSYYPKGIIISQARAGVGPSLVLSGILRYFLLAGDGRQITVRYLVPGDLVGSVVKDQPNLNRQIEVLKPAVLLNLDAAHVLVMAGRWPDLATALLDEVVSRLRNAYSVLSASAFMGVRSRVARDLLERATLCDRPFHPGLHLDVTQQALADATGSVREVVARALRELRKEKVIGPKGDGVTILDFSALERIAAGAN
jgi:CRP/FNR family transcriptional regulator, cyclic AMP receptor protein